MTPKRKKLESEEFEKLLVRKGWWLCHFCSNENWTVHHRSDQSNCPKTGIPREEAQKYEAKDEN